MTLEVVSDKKQLIIMPSTVTFTDKITKKEVNIKVRDNRVTEGRAEYGISVRQWLKDRDGPQLSP